MRSFSISLGSDSLDVYDTIAITIASNDGEIVGRTAIQKLVYFNTLKIPSIIISSYYHHFYGPYNHEVASALEEMVAFSYLEEKPFLGYTNVGYSYVLTNQGTTIANTIKKKFPTEFETISKTVQICNEFCSLKSAPLSYAAKAYYILRNTKGRKQGKYGAVDVERVAQNFDWEILKEDAQTGIELLEKLGLVEAVQ